jgi:hypothetical protein
MCISLNDKLIHSWFFSMLHAGQVTLDNLKELASGILKGRSYNWKTSVCDVTQKKTWTSNATVLVLKICEFRCHFRKASGTFCRRLLKLQYTYATVFLTMLRFFKKLSLSGVSDVTNSLVTWQSTNRLFLIHSSLCGCLFICRET